MVSRALSLQFLSRPAAFSVAYPCSRLEPGAEISVLSSLEIYGNKVRANDDVHHLLFSHSSGSCGRPREQSCGEPESTGPFGRFVSAAVHLVVTGAGSTVTRPGQAEECMQAFTLQTFDSNL